MFQISTDQKVCEVGGVKFGGQPGEYPCVCVSSIFQKGDKVFKGKRKEGFDEKKAEELLKTQERLTEETGYPVWRMSSPTREKSSNYLSILSARPARCPFVSMPG